jgi:glycosyltransferase involved in cell wall biosynthesis
VPSSVLMISHDLVGPQMAGAGMRYWELAQVLSRSVPVTLAAPEGSAPLSSGESVRLVAYQRHDSEALQRLAQPAQVIIAPGDTLLEFPFLLDSDKYLVMDGYDPHTLESLAWNESQPMDARVSSQLERLRIVSLQCAVGDFHICASERQRMLWLGWLEATGRVNPLTYDDDRALRTLVDTVPTGIPNDPPQHTRSLLRDVVRGIASEDHVLVWGGGVWNWLDPLTLIRAVARVARIHPHVRLYFPGPRHPYRQFVPDMSMHRAAVQLSQDLGLRDTVVFWGDWVPYHERQNYLLEADVGCSLHYETIESTFAFRTRILDYVWAGLPMIVTRGDVTSELVEDYGLGVVVDYEDEDGVAEAISHLLSMPRESFREGFVRARQERSWEQSAQPLVRFCLNPRHAADRRVAGGDWRENKPVLEQMMQQQREIARLRELLGGYERGRFMRFMKWLRAVRRRTTRRE